MVGIFDTGIFDTEIFDNLSASAAQYVTAFTAQAGRVGVMAANALGVAVPVVASII